MTKCIHSLCLVCLTLGVASSSSAQVVLGPYGPRNPDEKNVRQPNEPVVYRLKVTPAPEPDPPLKYVLYPRWTELQPGNSVPMWYRALDQIGWNHPRMKPMHENYSRWFPDDWQKMPVDEVRPFLQNMSSRLDDAQIAAHRERTEWDMGLRDLRGSDTINFLLEEFQESRHLTYILSLRIRLHLLDGEFDEALDDLAICFRLARDVAEPETFINDLIGIAISAISHENIRHFISMPGSPNLYWALADLPHPLIDIRDATAYEMTLPERYFPWLKDPASSERTSAQWQSLLVETLRESIRLVDSNGFPDRSASELSMQTALLGLCVRAYPRAKAHLIDAGYDSEDVDEMPVGKVIAIQEHLIYQTLSENTAAAMSLPTVQSLERLDHLVDQLRDAGYVGRYWQGTEAIPIASSLLPANSQMKEAQMRRESMRAALMTIEAIRMHLVESDGQLPESLDEITIVPVPDDPRTQEPFPYQLQGETAVIDVISRNYNQRFEIQVAEGTTK